MRLIYSEMSGVCEGVKAKNGNCLTRTREMRWKCQYFWERWVYKMRGFVQRAIVGEKIKF